MVDQLLADLARVKSVQAAVAFSRPGGVLSLQAVVDEAPLNSYDRTSSSSEACLVELRSAVTFDLHASVLFSNR